MKLAFMFSVAAFVGVNICRTVLHRRNMQRRRNTRRKAEDEDRIMAPIANTIGDEEGKEVEQPQPSLLDDRPEVEAVDTTQQMSLSQSENISTGGPAAESISWEPRSSEKSRNDPQSVEFPDTPDQICEIAKILTPSSSDVKQHKTRKEGKKNNIPFEVLLFRSNEARKALEPAAVANIIAAVTEMAFAVSRIQLRGKQTKGVLLILERAAKEEAVLKLRKALPNCRVQHKVSPRIGGGRAQSFSVYCFGQDEANARGQKKELRKFATKYLAWKPSKRGNRYADVST